MSIKIEPFTIDVLLLGVGGQRREVQAFPVLGDVWTKYAAAKPDERVDLLVTPTWKVPTGDVARIVANVDIPAADPANDVREPDRKVAYLQGLVVAKLTLDELIRVAIPATKWWDDIITRWEEEPPKDAKEGVEYLTNQRLAKWIRLELAALAREEQLARPGRAALIPEQLDDQDRRYSELEVEQRLIAKLGLLMGVLRAAARAEPKAESSAPIEPQAGDAQQPPSSIEAVLPADEIVAAGTEALRMIVEQHRKLREDSDKQAWSGRVFQVSLNRDAAPAVSESVGAIKGDAARSLFSISCKEISWAVLDSGIDQTHPAFWDYGKVWKELERNGGTWDARLPRPHRIKGVFDFRRIREIMSVEGADQQGLVEDILARRTDPSKQDPASIAALRKEIDDRLKEVAGDRGEGKRVNWARVYMLVECTNPDPKSGPPLHPHGTHVAGIIGAHWLKFKRGEEPKPTDTVRLSGVCPDINLYDFRVLGSTLGDSEFAVIAALEFIRFLNDQSGYSIIDGVNMSLSIPHDVRNYACGRTPVCVEAEALASNGVVVVAAAGNRGFQQYKLADNSLFASYAPSSITDPGNAEAVITVGATHREWPHTYGVSFFSSRGPTGDGRIKPDLLAPGEKISSCIPGAREDQMDGTSMAAPHVSGAAALLMARHEELKGKPERIKRILCDTATDLKRVQSFQGHGMVDVLRAIQSI